MELEADIPVVLGLGSPAWTAPLGRRVLVVTGAATARADPVLERLASEGREVSLASIRGEPDRTAVEALVGRIEAERSDSLVAVGGGSVIDAAKAAAVLATNPGGLLAYVEIVGRGEALKVRGLPLVAIPTTSGTGAEVTRNAVVTLPEAKLKVSFRGPFVFPSLAVIDPCLTLDLPASLTASTGMDALTQLIEPLLSAKANAASDRVAVAGLARVRGALRTAVRDGSDRAARESMAVGALLSGVALTRAGLGAVHGFASPIGGLTGAAHGAICAALLAPALAVNLDAVTERGSDEARRRFDLLGRILTGRDEAKAADAVRWVRDLSEDLGLARASALGVHRQDWEALAQQAAKTSSMRGNPVELVQAERIRILELAG